jgi:hypothetical protein
VDYLTALHPWLAALEQRHLANLTRSELTRSLRALSSCYVERREKLAGGAALEGAGKRAAFALFYGPLHFLTVDAVVRALGANMKPLNTIHDLGCGTGVGAAAWALACANAPSIQGIDRSAWAVAEANWTYNQLGVRGRARAGDIVRDFQISKFPDSPILLAYAVNELPAPARSALLDMIVEAAGKGTELLIVEPIARRDKEWWPEWEARLGAEGARADEWRFPSTLPLTLRQIAKGAGLDPRELTARTLHKPGAPSPGLRGLSAC